MVCWRMEATSTSSKCNRFGADRLRPDHALKSRFAKRLRRDPVHVGDSFGMRKAMRGEDQR
jgi:hypothetical protein